MKSELLTVWNCRPAPDSSLQSPARRLALAFVPRAARHACARLLLPLCLAAPLVPAYGQIYVADYYGNTVGEYSLSGAPINTSLIPGLSEPFQLAASGDDLFVGTLGNVGGLYAVGEYTLSGAAVNPSLITGLNTPTTTGPSGLAVSGNDLFVGSTANYAGSGAGTIAEYTTSGALVNPSLVSGLNYPYKLAVSGNNLFEADYESGVVNEFTTSGATVASPLINSGTGTSAVAISGNKLFVANFGAGTVSEYTTSGALVNASFLTGLPGPESLAVYGNDLFVGTFYNGTVGEYTLSGATVDSSLITGFESPIDLVVVPEPATWTLFAIGLALCRIRNSRFQKFEYAAAR
jgi:hypothetical protein